MTLNWIAGELQIVLRHTCQTCRPGSIGSRSEMMKSQLCQCLGLLPDGVGEQYAILPGARQEIMPTVNCLA